MAKKPITNVAMVNYVLSCALYSQLLGTAFEIATVLPQFGQKCAIVLHPRLLQKFAALFQRIALNHDFVSKVRGTATNPLQNN